MRVLKSVRSMQKIAASYRRQGKRIGFVPTMGALHEGHAALLKRCKRENAVSVLSIFVNPTQFGPNEDFAKYPRVFKQDSTLARRLGVDIIFYPSATEMYPEGFRSSVEVKALSDVLCGAYRPGHFKGVTTVVLKLLNCVSPDVLYLGQKDAQQALIIQTMIADLNIPVEVIVCPTVREKDGLALSSRNQYLSLEERKEAIVLFQGLKAAQERISRGERNSKKVVDLITEMIKKYSRGKIDYIACVNTKDLSPTVKIVSDCFIMLAVRFGKTRLIDNIKVKLK